MSFFEELKRRNVFRVGIAYLLMGWVSLQGADFVLDLIGAPDWVIRALAVAVAVGMPIALFFAWAFEVTPEGVKREADVDRSTSIAPTTGRKLDRAIILFLGVALVLVLGERFFFADRAPSSPTEAIRNEQAATATEESASRKSIAVLPFADLSQNGDQEWFADGLAEEILNALAKTPDLLVASRTSTFSYKGSDKNVLDIARELGVNNVLEGSVRSSGDRIRVTAQLIRAEDGFHIWSENYDRSPEDMIAIQEDLARSIAKAMETTMDPAQLAEMSRVGTRSVAAYQAYLRGLAAASEVMRDGQPAILETLEHFEAATDADPGFAAAYLKQADWWKGQLTPSYQGSGATALSVERLTERFTEAIDLAIENAASETDRRGYLAQKAEVDVRLRDAIELYEEYLAERPNDLAAITGLSSAARMAGNRAAIDNAMERIKERGKRDLEAAVFYVSNAYDLGNADEVADYGLERLEDWPDAGALAYQTHRALMWAGRAEEGASLARRAQQLGWINTLITIRQACIEGRREDAQAAMESIERGAGDRWRTSAWLGLKMLGEEEEARQVLQPIAQSSSPYQIASTLNYSIFDPAPYPELVEILDREGILRPPANELPYKCPPAAGTSIAVLPFVNMSSDTEQEYFSDGISEEILNVLAQVPDLKVAGRTSSFAFKGRQEDLRTIGQTLGVNHILEGSVRKSGNQVRITAQLIKANDGFHLWSETFDRELTDVFAIQDEIAAAILAALETELLGAVATRVVEVNLEAYDLYLRARQLTLGRSVAGMQEASALLDRVIEIAPDYAPAFAERATTELLLGDQGGAYGSIPIAVAAANASAWIDQALALDPDLADAYAARGFLYVNTYQLEDAQASLQRALELNPNHVNATHWLSGVYGQSGRLGDARRLKEAVYELDPLFVPGVGGLAVYYSIFGTPERIGPLVDRSAPYLQGAALTYVEGVRAFGKAVNGNFAEAIRLTDALRPDKNVFSELGAFFSYFNLMEYERALTYNKDSDFAMLALSRLDRTEEALQLSQRFLERGEGLWTTIQVLAENQRFNEIIELVESRYKTLEAFAEANQGGGNGPDQLGHLVYAYRLAGRESDAEEMLGLFREILTRNQQEGADNRSLSWALAHLAVLEGDNEAALGHLERAVEQGYLEENNFTEHWVAFRPLLGEPRLDALVTRMNEHRNEQRALLDLPPIGMDS